VAPGGPSDPPAKASRGWYAGSEDTALHASAEYVHGRSRVSMASVLYSPGAGRGRVGAWDARGAWHNSWHCMQGCHALRRTQSSRLQPRRTLGAAAAAERVWRGCAGGAAATTGRDASDDFDDVGHSKNALNMMEKYLIGDLKVAWSSWAANNPN